jgi:hypothetical protein
MLELLYGHDISNELQNKKTVVITKPKHTQAEREANDQGADEQTGEQSAERD